MAKFSFFWFIYLGSTWWWSTHIVCRGKLIASSCNTPKLHTSSVTKNLCLYPNLVKNCEAWWSTQICQNCVWLWGFEGILKTCQNAGGLPAYLPYFPWTLSTKKQTPAKKLYHMSLLKIRQQQLFFFWGGGGEPWITVPEGVSSKKTSRSEEKKNHGPKQTNEKHTKDQGQSFES